MNKKMLLLLSLLFFTAEFALAGACVMSVTREACPGQEKISYEKCKGEKSCEEKKPASDEMACETLAKDACKNSRLDITKSKVIKAKFNGKDVANGADVCAGPREDFNRCN